MNPTVDEDIESIISRSKDQMRDTAFPTYRMREGGFEVRHGCRPHGSFVVRAAAAVPLAVGDDGDGDG